MRVDASLVICFMLGSFAVLLSVQTVDIRAVRKAVDSIAMQAQHPASVEVRGESPGDLPEYDIEPGKWCVQLVDSSCTMQVDCPPSRGVASEPDKCTDLDQKPTREPTVFEKYDTALGKWCVDRANAGCTIRMDDCQQ